MNDQIPPKNNPQTPAVDPRPILLSKDEAEAIATVVQMIRPSWQRPGIMSALSKSARTGTVGDVALAAIRCARNESIRFPNVIAMDGTHWKDPDRISSGGLVRGPESTEVDCVDHPGFKAGSCPECERTAVPKPETFDEIVARAALEAAREAQRMREAREAEEEEAERRRTVREAEAERRRARVRDMLSQS